MLRKLWNSPTIMTWLSYSTKALTLFGVLPQVLGQFSAADIVIWYLFVSIISLQSLLDFGFRSTFSRIISYAYSGARNIYIYKSDEILSQQELNIVGSPNLNLLGQIISTMRFIYLRLTLGVLVLLGFLGTWALLKPFQNASNINEAWLSWLIILIVTCISFYGKIYLNVLEGLNKIALVRRVEAFTSIGGILTSIATLYFFPSLLNLIVANQVWVLITTIRDWYLCKKVDNSICKSLSVDLPFNKDVFLKIWKSAWRAGLSGVMSISLTNITGLLYAQIGTTANVASYLLALRLISQVRDISMAPFYSKLPLLAMLRVKNDIVTLRKVVSKGMLLSHLTFFAGFICIGFSMEFLLQIMKSDVQSIDHNLWILLGVAFFIHRYGAMHIQVYLSTNHIISHIADGVSGVMFIIISFSLSYYVGIYAVPIGMILSYLGFYSWYSAKHSYKSLCISPWQFEKNVLVLPLAIGICYIFFQTVYFTEADFSFSFSYLFSQ